MMQKHSFQKRLFGSTKFMPGTKLSPVVIRLVAAVIPFSSTFSSACCPVVCFTLLNMNRDFLTSSLSSL